MVLEGAHAADDIIRISDCPMSAVEAVWKFTIHWKWRQIYSAASSAGGMNDAIATSFGDHPTSGDILHERADRRHLFAPRRYMACILQYGANGDRWRRHALVDGGAISTKPFAPQTTRTLSHPRVGLPNASHLLTSPYWRDGRGSCVVPERWARELRPPRLQFPRPSRRTRSKNRDRPGNMARSVAWRC